MKESTGLVFPWKVPEGFEGIRNPSGYFLLSKKENPSRLLERVFSRPDPEAGGEATAHSGRSPLRRFSLPSGEALLRVYRPGGLFRFVRGEGHRDPSRVFEELSLCLELRNNGISAPEPLAAAALGNSGSYRLFFLSRELKGEDFLNGLLREKNLALRSTLLDSVGKAIRRLHDRDFFHADLQPKNIFLSGDSREVFFLDLSGSYHRDQLPRSERVANLARLYRFGEKWQALHGVSPWTREEFLRLLQGYDPGREQELIQEVERVSRRGKLWHRIGWSVDRWLNAQSR